MSTETAYVVIRAEQPRDAALPGWMYWNGALNMWGAYATATRYDHTLDLSGHRGPMPASAIAAAPVHPTDTAGWPYEAGEGMSWRLTTCCAAAASASDPDAGLWCKSCYRSVEDAAGGEPTL